MSISTALPTLPTEMKEVRRAPRAVFPACTSLHDSCFCSGSQAGGSSVPGSGAVDSAKEPKPFVASRRFETAAERTEPGVGVGFCA
jgi:hypothetical protein